MDVACASMNNSQSVAMNYYLRITDAHRHRGRKAPGTTRCCKGSGARMPRHARNSCGHLIFDEAKTSSESFR